MNGHSVKVLPFKMANMKPPIFVLKKIIYPLEGFPRDPPQQLETDSEMLVVYISLVGYTSVLQSSCLMMSEL